MALQTWHCATELEDCAEVIVAPKMSTASARRNSCRWKYPFWDRDRQTSKDFMSVSELFPRDLKCQADEGCAWGRFVREGGVALYHVIRTEWERVN